MGAAHFTGLQEPGIIVAKVPDVGNPFRPHARAAEVARIKITQPALNYFVINSGGNDQRDIKIISLAKLTPRGLGVNQPRDSDQCFPDRAEAAGRDGSVMNGQAEPKPGLPVPPVDADKAGGQSARKISHQGQAVHAFGQDGEFPVPAWQPVPVFASQARALGGPGKHQLESVLGPGLLGRVSPAIPFDIDRDKIAERQTLRPQCLHHFGPIQRRIPPLTGFITHEENARQTASDLE